MIGVVVLVLALLACLPLFMRWAANADPGVLLRVLRLAAMLVTGAAALLVVIFGRGLVLSLLAPLIFGLFMQWRRARNMAKTARGPTPGKGSEVRTRFLSMRLDHDSGTMHGRVIDGPHAGASLADLGESRLFDLLHFYTGNDPRSAQLLESWLDREGPEHWRDRAANEASPPGSAGMSRSEAYKVLGLTPGAAAAEIRAAHRRLMREYHPDRGGSTFFAAQINQAKDILLGS